MARDATARLYDVDADAVVMDKKAGTIVFHAKKGRLVDLDKLHESIWATRFGDGTGMQLKVLEVTAVGEVVVADKELRLKLAGSDQFFLLEEDASAKPGALREAVQRGAKVVSVTGQVDGWRGNLTQFSKTLPPRPRKILVKDFQIAQP